MALGFIIFGWPKRTKEFGAAFYYQCPACEKDAFHGYIRARRWITIYFIPLIPLGGAEFYAMCGNCGFTEEIESKEDAKLFKEASKLTGEYSEGARSDEDYWPRMEEMMRESDFLMLTEEVEEIEEPQTPRGIE